MMPVRSSGAPLPVPPRTLEDVWDSHPNGLAGDAVGAETANHGRDGGGRRQIELSRFQRRQRRGAAHWRHGDPGRADVPPPPRGPGAFCRQRRPEVQQAIDEAIAAIRKAGKSAGILVERDSTGRYLDQGAQFLYAHTNAFLSLGAFDFAGLLAKR